ncbi:MAG: diaminopimelate epimerase [Dehalococcoidales bacterium]|nr:diaminopimelate epimerase [Dehalococcoidales bacterium]
MNFTKMHGAGNDFVLVETNNMQRDWSPVAIALCDRHFGVGADGLLLLSYSNVADFRMRIFNADGSEATACGNGLRCMVKYFVDKNSANYEAREISVETAKGVRKAKVYKTKDKSIKIKVNMGSPKFGEKDIPVVIEQDKGNIVDIKSMLIYSLTVGSKLLLLNLVFMGNPHAVYFYDHPVADFPLSRIGPKVEQNQIFPDGVNFEVAQVLDRQHIEARIWERGVGETLACGSGACAITVAARLHGYIDDKVDIKVPGGILGVEWGGVGEVFLNGPAETVFTGEWTDGRLILS